jgi:DNA-binding IclR family transcriptional regulator
MEAEQPGHRRLAARVLAVLDAFAVERPELTLSEISRRTGLPLPTVHRLVGELVQWGALVRRDDRAYEIGPGLLRVAALAPWNLCLREAAMPYLADLYVATQQTVHLSILDGTDVVLVEAISCRGAGVSYPVGTRLPAHLGNAGRVMLAYAPVDVQERLCASLTLTNSTGPSLTAQLRRQLAEIRKAGIADFQGQHPSETRSTAAPVHGGRGAVVGAISILVEFPADARSLVPSVRVAASAISRAVRSRSARGPAGRDGVTVSFSLRSPS